MPGNIILPQWGMGMNEGQVVRWLKSVGDPVVKGDPLVEIESTKVNAEVEATADGTLGRIVVEEGKTVPVGTILGLLLLAGESDRDLPEEAPKQEANPSGSPARQSRAQSRSSGSRVVVTPRARRLARELNVDLDNIQSGTGPSGRVTEDDIRAAAEAPTAPESDLVVSQRIPLSGMRGVIARRMLQSASGALVTLNTTADVTNTIAFQRQLIREWRRSRIRPQYQDLVIAATVRALKDNPLANAHLTENEVVVYETINIGFALAVPDGLLVPMIKDAGTKSPLEIAQETREIARKAKANELRPEELSGSTFSITNLSNYDVENFNPIINPPEVGILGVGKVVDRPTLTPSGEIENRSVGHFSLTFEHRAWDGAPAADLLGDIVRNIANPEWMTNG